MPSPKSRLVPLLLLLAPALLHAQSPLLPTSVAYDSAGNLYFADTNRNQVFESSLAGVLTVVAGTGTQGFSGDNGPATAATLNAPQAIAIAANGTIYIADTGNHRIRTIVSGTITTIAGTGLAGYSGDNGPAISAALNTPTALALDSTGNLLIADTNNHRIRRIASGQITTIAGSGIQGFSGDNAAAIFAQLDSPSGLATAPDGRIFLSDTHNDRIRVISTAGIISTFAGTGERGYAGDGAAATSAKLALPRGLLYTNGSLLLADSNNQRIRTIDASGNITTLVGNGIQGSSTNSTLAASAPLDTPRSVALSAFSAPVLADTANRTVRELLPNAALYTPAGLTPSRNSAVSLSMGSSTYGQSQAVITVSGVAAIPQGIVQVLEGVTALAQSSLVAGSATLSLPTLSGGAHNLTAVYAGDGVNPTATTTSSVTIDRAPTSTTEQPIAQNSYAGLPLILTASVASAAGTPTGTINFLSGSSIVAAATLANGSASALYLTPPAGTLYLTANYAGDTNFAPSSSAPVSATVSASPDFTLAVVGPTTQTVQGGSIAVYNLAIAPQSAPFTGAVSFSVTGLQPGATATFSPPQVIPGASSAAATLSIQTLALAHVAFPHDSIFLALIVPLILLRRKRRPPAAVLLLLTSIGCGDRTLSPSAQTTRTFPMTVTATSTNLAGAVITHTASITLSIQ